MTEQLDPPRWCYGDQYWGQHMWFVPNGKYQFSFTMAGERYFYDSKDMLYMILDRDDGVTKRIYQFTVNC